ncbi:MAG TPA: hypothetical protein VK766_02305 [Cytophagaceae bacterium]|jgi:hypothetical protein|nr:hypothetical protein [Cytophagaceae bacterium]
MKRITLILMAVVYLFLSIGIRVNTHYCGDRISSIDFFFDDSKCCGKKDIMKCCKDKISYFKIDTNQNYAPSFAFSISQLSAALVPAIDYSNFYIFFKQKKSLRAVSFYSSDKPPRKNAVYILYHSFRV